MKLKHCVEVYIFGFSGLFESCTYFCKSSWTEGNFTHGRYESRTISFTMIRLQSIIFTIQSVLVFTTRSDYSYTSGTKGWVKHLFGLFFRSFCSLLKDHGEINELILRYGLSSHQFLRWSSHSWLSSSYFGVLLTEKKVMHFFFETNITNDSTSMKGGIDHILNVVRIKIVWCTPLCRQCIFSWL